MDLKDFKIKEKDIKKEKTLGSKSKLNFPQKFGIILVSIVIVVTIGTVSKYMGGKGKYMGGKDDNQKTFNEIIKDKPQIHNTIHVDIKFFDYEYGVVVLDSTITRRKVYEFDINNRLIKTQNLQKYFSIGEPNITYYKYNQNEIIVTSFYNRDENKYNTEYRDLFSSGEIKKRKYLYNDKGQFTGLDNFYGNNRVSWKYFFSENEIDSLFYNKSRSTSTYDLKKVTINKIKYKYDLNGKMVNKMYYNFHGDIAFYWIFRYDKQGKLIEKSCFSEEMYLLNRKFKPKLTGACSSLDYEFNSFGSNWLENNYKDINLNEFDIIKNINPLFDNGRKNIYEYNNNNQIINHYMKKTSYSESIFSYSYNIDNSINEILVDNQYLLKFYYDNINVLRQVITFEIINEMNTEKAIKIIEYNFSYYDEESVPPIEKN